MRQCYTGYCARIARMMESKTAILLCGRRARHMCSCRYDGRCQRVTPYRRLKVALHADHRASILHVNGIAILRLLRASTSAAGYGRCVHCCLSNDTSRRSSALEPYSIRYVGDC